MCHNNLVLVLDLDKAETVGNVLEELAALLAANEECFFIEKGRHQREATGVEQTLLLL